MLEKDGHRIFAVVGKYFPIKFRNLGDANAGEAARFMELTHLCIGGALFSFFSRYQEGLEVGVDNEGTGSVFATALNFSIFFSGSSGEGYSTFCSGCKEQSGR